MIRVFPRKTNMTPIDDKVYFTGPPLEPLEDHIVNVSCTFTWDKPRAEILAKQWDEQGYDVSVGGPAYGDFGGEFVPGRYIKNGAVLTSRGCNNRCWFCYVWKREGVVREIEIKDGYNILDSNILQCSERHIRAVFDMLARRPERPKFTGGLEAKLLRDWHIGLLDTANPKAVYFAYDTEDDYEPLRDAAKMVFKSTIRPSSHIVSCYVLIGYPKDTIEKAEQRIQQVKDLGLVPYAMLYRNDKGYRKSDWISFQAQNANPVKIFGKKKELKMELFND